MHLHPSSTRPITPVAPLIAQWRSAVLSVPQDIPQMEGTPVGLLLEADRYSARVAVVAAGGGGDVVGTGTPADRNRLEEACFAMELEPDALDRPWAELSGTGGTGLLTVSPQP